jgi:hypothetical protein
MFELIQIQFFGKQPTAKVSRQLLKRIICREFRGYENDVEQKLNSVTSDTLKGKYRISAAIMKLANKDFDSMDELIKISNNDCRDILARAEYPRNYEIGFEELTKAEMKRIYFADWNEYTNWLKKI